MSDLSREARKAKIGQLLGIKPTPEHPLSTERPAYSRAPWIGFTISARWNGTKWVHGFGNYSGHHVDLFESDDGPYGRDWLDEIEAHANLAVTR
jgi:hypothetical protein